MPTIVTRGAGSARGFGFAGAAGVSPAFLAVLVSPTNNNVYGITTDSKNNIIFVSGAGNNILCKVTSRGVSVWAKTFALQFCTLRDVTVDSNDNIYVVGEIFSPNTYGLIMKFDSSGNLLWQYLQDAGNATYYPRGISWRSVKVMPNGNVAVAGLYQDNTRQYVCNCGCGYYVKVNNNFGALAVYNSSGSLQWGRKFGGTSISTNPTSYYWFSVGVDSSNNIYVSGSGPSINSGGAKAVPIIKYDSSGVYQWGYQYKNSASTVSWDGVLTVTSAGNIYAASPSQYAPYVLLVNSSGTCQWGRTFSSPGGNYPVNQITNVATDSVGNPYYVGSVNDYTIADTANMGLFKFNSTGTLQYARALGYVSPTGASEQGTAITLSSDGYISMGGNNSALNDELFTRLKSDGSQTGSYTVNGQNYKYSSFPSTVVSDTPTVTNAKTQTWPDTCDDFAMTYTSATSSISPSSVTPTISVTTL